MIRGILLILFVYGVDLGNGHPHSEDVMLHLDHESHLYHHILDHYIKELRPASAINDTVIVSVDVSVTSIHGLDEDKEEMKSSVALSIGWDDPRLSWNTSDYDGLHSFTIPASKIWRPELKLVHSQYGSFQHFGNEYVTIHYDGSVYWSSHAKIRSYCPLNMANFPFDSHVCHLELAANVYNQQQIQLKFFKRDGEIVINEGALLSKNSQWSVSKKDLDSQIVTVMHPEPLEVIAVTVELSRKSSFYKCIILGPAVILALLVPVVFLLPTDSTAKITLGGLIMVTMCLSMKTLVDVIGAKMATVPNIAIYYSVTMVLTSFSIIMSAIITCITRQEACRKHVPVWFSQIFLGRCGLRRWLCMDTSVPGDHHSAFTAMKHTENEFAETDSDVTALKEGDHDAKDIPKSVRVLIGKYQTQNENKGHSSEWMEIARVVDRLLFILFLALFLLTTLALLS
ncbi:hypothetical protein LOTGIDRAFT_162441 [Lottia gigantea]|uniref:Neurotransmitter-gated ion-channel ligand-binding domain-containing protein n=1 Tax=Lottia gigantea TaxID=225164 RepID=V4ABS6_LOTGI|nr:hypothetical protein LOTGIDRAFT_162441 [Lottia gigantea]ESO92535.1 hypothetical protein LOTGIDRAFT_162441 [Lottia gigantea]